MYLHFDQIWFDLQLTLLGSCLVFFVFFIFFCMIHFIQEFLVFFYFGSAFGFFLGQTKIFGLVYGRTKTFRSTWLGQLDRVDLAKKIWV